MEPRRNGVVGGNSRPLFPIRQHWVAYPDHVTSPQARRSAPRQGTAHSPAGNAPPTPPLICCTSTISARRAVPPPSPSYLPQISLQRPKTCPWGRLTTCHAPCAMRTHPVHFTSSPPPLQRPHLAMVHSAPPTCRISVLAMYSSHLVSGSPRLWLGACWAMPTTGGWLCPPRQVPTLRPQGP